MWYGIWAAGGLADGWTVAHAVATLTGDITMSATLQSYLTQTSTVPMDPHSAVPLPSRIFARTLDFLTFLSTPNAPKLGTIDLANNLEYASLRTFLWDLGGTFLREIAPQYGSPESVSPCLVRTNMNAVAGWGETPFWIDPISSAAFTLNLVGGASPEKNIKMYGGGGPLAFLEKKMSSAFYYEGLGYLTQHWEAAGPTASSGQCAFDLDCPAGACTETSNCVPLSTAGFDGGKIPGTYFGSSKGQAGVPQFTIVAEDGWRTTTLKSSGRLVIPAKYKGPAAPDETWDFEGFFAHSTFKALSWLRRIENCNYPDGRVIDGETTDSRGIDCNFVKDTALMADTGIPLYWTTLIRDSTAPGWDPALTNAEDGAKSIKAQEQVRVTSCRGNRFCTFDFFNSKGSAFTNYWAVAYEPNLGVMVDINVCLGLAWKLIPTKRHQQLAKDGYKFIPITWTWVWLHLPGAINMDLAKLQLIPAALNGFYIFLLGQCLISLVGGFACCFCGI